MSEQMNPKTQQHSGACNQLQSTDHYKMLMRAVEIDYENIARFGATLPPGSLISDLVPLSNSGVSSTVPPKRK